MNRYMEIILNKIWRDRQIYGQNDKQRYIEINRIMDRMLNKDIQKQTELWTEC